MCHRIALQTLLCCCVYSSSDMSLFLCVCSVIKHNISFSFLTPPPPITFLSSFFFIFSLSPSLTLLPSSHSSLPRYSNVWWGIALPTPNPLPRSSPLLASPHSCLLSLPSLSPFFLSLPPLPLFSTPLLNTSCQRSDGLYLLVVNKIYFFLRGYSSSSLTSTFLYWVAIATCAANHSIWLHCTVWRLPVKFSKSLAIKNPLKIWTHQQKTFYKHKNGTPGWTVYVLYPTDGPQLDPNLNQNWIGLFLSPNQLTQQFLSLSIQNFLKYHAAYRFLPHLSMVKNRWKKL